MSERHTGKVRKGRLIDTLKHLLDNRRELLTCRLFKTSKVFNRNIIIKSWIYPISISLIVLLLSVLIWGFKPYCLPLFFGVFAVSSKLFDSIIIREKINNLSIEKIKVHRDYALKDIGKVESCIHKKSSAIAMRTALEVLENKLLCMFGCCGESDPMKRKLKDLRGNLGNFRTQLLLPDCKKPEIFREIAQETQSLRPYLEEI